jgi:hypothetical protein
MNSDEGKAWLTCAFSSPTSKDPKRFESLDA